jgi:predicted amidohydrolase YtcJ
MEMRPTAPTTNDRLRTPTPTLDVGLARGRLSAVAGYAIVNASVRTLDEAKPEAEAVAVRDGLIVAVGSAAEAREAAGSAEIVDAGGAAMVPGLVDAHIHPFEPGMVMGADLTRCGNLADVQAALEAERRRGGPDDWVLGWGVSYEAFRGSEIGSSLIEDATGGAPAMITFMDQHTALANGRALALAGVTGAVEFTEAAEVVVREGLPTGELREDAAMSLVEAAMPAVTARERYARVVETLRTLNACGVTGVHVMKGGPDTFDLARELEAAGDLTVRAIVPLWQQPETSFDEMRDQLRYVGERGRRWRGGAAKFFIDGVIDTGTGWLYAPDTQGDGMEPFWPDPGRYAEAVRLFAQAGFQCITHATGERGVRAALDAYLAAGAAAGVRHRVEHIETVTDADLARFPRENVIASMQPLHMQWRQDDYSDSWAARLGPERAGRAWRTVDLLRAGATLTLGSDWPVAQLDPRIGMAWARLRREPGAPDRRTFEPDQRLSGLEALEGYTTGAAATAGESALGGRIAPGLRADLTILAEDPALVAPDDLLDLPVRMTIVDGEIVYAADG